jgi:hypothetical protein
VSVFQQSAGPVVSSLVAAVCERERARRLGQKRGWNLSETRRHVTSSKTLPAVFQSACTFKTSYARFDSALRGSVVIALEWYIGA